LVPEDTTKASRGSCRVCIARNFAEIRNERHQEAVSQVARALASR
jgi:hypothetical protein